MTFLNRTFIIFFLFPLTFLISCSGDDNDSVPMELTVSTSDFSTTMDENPENGHVIGTLRGETNEGTVSFSILEQSPEMAFSIDISSGELKVLDASLFNYEINPILTGLVKISNGTLFELATVTITLNDIEEDRPFEGDVILTTQDEINQFGNAGYTRIIGNLTIGNYGYDDIEDLIALLNIEKIEGPLVIYNCSNLKTTIGLRNLSYIGGHLTIANNPKLQEIRDLDNITNVDGISISDNLSLSSIDGFNQLTEIRGSLELFDTQLKNLNALENLEYVGTDLTISFNLLLENIDGLFNLSSIGESLALSNNPLLTNLNGLSNASATISKLYIHKNRTLENIDGLHKIDANEFVTINSNYSLKNLDGLLRIQNIIKLEVSENNSLTNLNGLRNLSKVGDYGLEIKRNYKLSTLTGLNGIIQIEGPLTIEKNLLLRDFCELQNFLFNGVPTSYNVTDNFYNPTVQEIVDGACRI